jgi:lipopolysaccharide/colanic/teichoic acid biosynthesis glycosyltransferase
MYARIKRLLDFVVALVALVVLSPLLLALILWIKLADPGPVFYAGVRVGRGGTPFRMIKFRTMVVDADKVGPSSTAGDDPRITRPGRFMRRYKVDELSQLLNVLRGDMSLVGPRPQVQWAVDLYTPEERALLTVRPGITDFASLRFRNEAEILHGSTDPDKDYLEKIAPLKIRLGLYYVRNYSFAADAKILLATALSIAGVDPAWCLPRLAPANARRDLTTLEDAGRS